jgi:hypothetical protein
VSVTYNGQATPFPTQVNVAPSAVGIYTLGNSGLGPGAFTGMDGSGNTFAAPATNGETVTAMATGLGAVSGPANALPSTFPNFPGVEVFVGTQAATVTYAGRSTCCVGLDQITFEVPAGVAGCYVPVAVRSGGTISNFVSIAVSSDGGQCSDTAPTIPISVMNQAMAGQSVKAAAFAAGPVPVLQGLGFNEKLYLTAKLSKLLHVKLSQQEVVGYFEMFSCASRAALRIRSSSPFRRPISDSNASMLSHRLLTSGRPSSPLVVHSTNLTAYCGAAGKLALGRSIKSKSIIGIETFIVTQKGPDCSGPLPCVALLGRAWRHLALSRLVLPRFTAFDHSTHPREKSSRSVADYRVVS